MCFSLVAACWHSVPIPSVLACSWITSRMGRSPVDDTYPAYFNQSVDSSLIIRLVSSTRLWRLVELSRGKLNSTAGTHKSHNTTRTLVLSTFSVLKRLQSPPWTSQSRLNLSGCSVKLHRPLLSTSTTNVLKYQEEVRNTFKAFRASSEDTVKPQRTELLNFSLLPVVRLNLGDETEGVMSKTISSGSGFT